MCEWASKQTLDLRILPRRDPNKACLEALLQFSPERVYINLCGNDINIVTTLKGKAENIFDLVRRKNFDFSRHAVFKICILYHYSSNKNSEIRCIEVLVQLIFRSLNSSSFFLFTNTTIKSLCIYVY